MTHAFIYLILISGKFLEFLSPVSQYLENFFEKLIFCIKVAPFGFLAVCSVVFWRGWGVILKLENYRFHRSS